jgi:3-keto-L-gulonate-6-phosphate decarboxylase
VAAQDLRIQRKCEATLVYTDLKTFAVGTWCEMWEAKKLGQMVIVLTPSPPQTIRSVFIKAYADYIVDWSSLEEVLEKCI